jgi:hypothetical protein
MVPHFTKNFKLEPPMITRLLLLVTLTTILSACSAPRHAPDLGKIYNKLAQREDPYRNPIFTCFQFDYDWRRDIVENAQGLDWFIKEKTRLILSYFSYIVW